MFKYETHCHTADGSRCGRIPMGKVLNFYKEKNYDGVFITDHFLNANTTVDKSQPWEKQVEDYFKNFEKAKELGKRIGIDVFFGWEYGYYYMGKGGKNCGGNDFLTYGLDEKWLLNHPEVMEIELTEYCDLVHKGGGFIIHAHPFRHDSYIDMIRLIPGYVDGVEVLNSSMKDENVNKMAEIYADFYKLPKTSGSDLHYFERERISGIKTENRITSAADMLKELKSGKIEIFVENI